LPKWSNGPAYAAIDLGASSGRVVAGRLADGRIALEVVQRFANRPVRLPTALHWNLLHLFTEALDGLRRVDGLAGIGVDTWGVDYGLLDRDGHLLGLPFHYRDERTAGMAERAFDRVSAAELYAVTGIQSMPINTVFQLLSEERSPALSAAEGIALVPDLLAYWLSGELANESSAASTTGLLDARSGQWALDVIERLGLPTAPFGGVIDPGTLLGPALAHHDLGPAPVYSVAGHDTASAFAAAPVSDPHAAVLSSGTWSLLGLELPEPVLTDAAREANLTNERGVDGTIRLLKNVMGLWLEQECARVWDAAFGDLHALARAAPADVPLFDPDDEGFLRPGDMPARIAAACRRAGQREPRDHGETIRAIHVSLACKYRYVLERLEAVSGRDITSIHVIGGGARSELLCRLTADLTGRPLLVGPIEATALGNVLVQARAAGELASLAEMREVATASAAPVLHEPGANRDEADATYGRFLDVTGLATPATA
jgi:rhamnulokinase